MRAVITRHYKTLINASEQILGWGDSPRDKGWKADVDFVSERLQEKEISFDAVHSSDLERSRLQCFMPGCLAYISFTTPRR